MSSAVPSADVGLDCVSGPDPGLEDAAMSRVFNRRRPERRPVAVLRARSAEDLAAGVRLVNQRGWRVDDSDFTRRPQKLMSDRNFELLRQSAAAREPRGVFASYLLPEGAVLNENTWELEKERA